MSLYRVLHGEFESAVKMKPNIVKILIFTNFDKKNDFYKKSIFEFIYIYIYIWVYTSIYIYIFIYVRMGGVLLNLFLFRNSVKIYF